MHNDTADRARMLDDTVFQTLQEILFRNTQEPPRANAQELEALLAISRCVGASVETKAFAREMWLQLSCPGIHAVGKSSIEKELRRWRTREPLLLDHVR